jgi:hypothetical protein
MLKVEATADLLTLVSVLGEDVLRCARPITPGADFAGILTGLWPRQYRLRRGDLQRQETLYAFRDDFSTGLLDDFFLGRIFIIILRPLLLALGPFVAAVVFWARVRHPPLASDEPKGVA